MPHLPLGQPSREEFLIWREHPVTEWVFRACQATALEVEKEWTEASWGNRLLPEANLLRDQLLSCRTKADTWNELVGASYDDCCARLGQDPTAGDE